MFYAPEGLTSAVILLGPLMLGVAGVWVTARGHWAGRLLGAPALLMGVMFGAALVKDGPGYAGVWLLVYVPLLLVIGWLSVIRPRPR